MGWTNSDYSYIYHLAGSCQTPEEAHRVLSESLSTRKMAIREYTQAIARRKVDKAILQRKIDASQDDLEKESLALDIEKLNVHEETESADYEYALHEVEFLAETLSRLEPHCNWSSGKLTRQEGYQLAQQEERRLILLERAKLSLLSVGNIDTETLREVKSHPEMKSLEQAFVAMVRQAKSGELSLGHNAPVFLLATGEPK